MIQHRLKISGLLILCMMIGTACQSPTIPNFYADKIVTVNPDGRMAPYSHINDDGEWVNNGYPSTELQMNDFEKRFKASGRKKILIYVFGGMNSVDDTVIHSQKLIKSIWETSDYYPIMINWESSLVESYADHLFFIRNGVRSYWLGPPLSPFYLIRDIARASVNLPVNLIRQSVYVFDNDYDIPTLSDHTLTLLQKSKMRFSIGADNAARGKSIFTRGYYFMGLPARMLTTPIIEAFGKSGWDVMVHRARSGFEIYDVNEWNNDINDYIAESLSPEQGALGHFLDRLEKLQQEDSGCEITAIGHSMGPYIINEMLLQYSHIDFRNIIYMASACSIRDGVSALKPYLETHPKTTFYNLCVHPRAEDEEMLPYGVVPQGSVLEWIDLYFSNQLTADDYTMGRWWIGMIRLPRLFDNVQGQVVHKAFGFNDPTTNDPIRNMPQIHTDFSNPVLRFWLPAFWKIPMSADSKILCKP